MNDIGPPFEIKLIVFFLSVYRKPVFFNYKNSNDSRLWMLFPWAVAMSISKIFWLNQWIFEIHSCWAFKFLMPPFPRIDLGFSTTRWIFNKWNFHTNKWMEQLRRAVFWYWSLSYVYYSRFCFIFLFCCYSWLLLFDNILFNTFRDSKILSAMRMCSFQNKKKIH